MKYRSNLEREIVKYLNSVDIRFEYDKHRLLYVPKKRTYIPDFYIPSADFFVEGKGYFHDSHERTRHLLIRDQLDVDVRFIFQNPNNRLTKGSKTTYADWCERYKFEYCGISNIAHDWFL